MLMSRLSHTLTKVFSRVLRPSDVIKDFVFKDKDSELKAKDFVIKAKDKSSKTHHCFGLKNSRLSSCSLMKIKDS